MRVVKEEFMSKYLEETVSIMSKLMQYVLASSKVATPGFNGSSKKWQNLASTGAVDY